jgi:hypothetical protein
MRIGEQTGPGRLDIALGTGRLGGFVQHVLGSFSLRLSVDVNLEVNDQQTTPRKQPQPLSPRNKGVRTII